VKVQKHKHGRAVVVPPYIELMKALVIFLSARASEALEHLTYVTHAVAGAVVKMLDGLKEPDFDEVAILGINSSRSPDSILLTTFSSRVWSKWPARFRTDGLPWAASKLSSPKW
jgi:hypothetical protein